VNGFSSPRMRWALLIALLSDALGFGMVLFPLLQWLLDAITAIALLMVLGFRWPLLIALAIEVIPAIELFPAWTLVVLFMASGERGKGPGIVNRKSKIVNRKS
jgi:hypothetical protein